MTRKQCKQHIELLMWWVEDPNNEVLCRSKTNKADDWFPCREVGICNNFYYIKNDEYVELRKEACDGKVIQVKSLLGNWVDLDENIDLELYDLVDLRVKPDEPTFKLGDWVLGLSCTYKITQQEQADTLNSSVIKLDKWEPKLEEYVMFYTNESDISTYTIGIYGGLTNGLHYNISNNTSTKYVAPLLFDKEQYTIKGD